MQSWAKSVTQREKRDKKNYYKIETLNDRQDENCTNSN